MNHYISTYRQDYTRPQVSRTRQLLSSQIIDHKITKDLACICMDSQKELEKFLQVHRESSDWSCTDLMERPLKLYLTIDKDKPDKPKLKPPAVKRPDPCEEFYDEVSARVDADRFKTTYQIDYSDPAAARMAQRDKPSTITERDREQMQCCLPIRIIIQPDSRPHCYSHPSRDDKSLKVKKRDYPQRNIPKCGKKSEDDKGGPLLPWKSEYQDSIDKIGHGIIKVKLHHTKGKVAPMHVTSN